MSVLNQKTLKKSLKFEGIGLHSGKKVVMTLIPARPNTVIIFKRSDLKINNLIHSSVFNVSSASYCTKLTNENGVSVSTVEHLMAALCGLGIDNEFRNDYRRLHKSAKHHTNLPNIKQNYRTQKSVV